MSKVDEALDKIKAVEDATERALFVGALITTLLKLKGVMPIIVGQTALDCYSNVSHGRDELLLAFFSGKPTPRVLQEVLGEQLKGEGGVWRWRIANINIRFAGDVYTEHRDLCRDFQTDFGIAKLVPVEELIAERVLAAVYPRDNIEARQEAKQLLVGALMETFLLEWPVLQKICDSPGYRVGEALAVIRAETKKEIDEQLALHAALEAAGSQAAAEDATVLAPIPSVPELKPPPAKPTAKETRKLGSFLPLASTEAEKTPAATAS
jgi:hypothetical protein